MYCAKLQNVFQRNPLNQSSTWTVSRTGPSMAHLKYSELEAASETLPEPYSAGAYADLAALLYSTEGRLLLTESNEESHAQPLQAQSAPDVLQVREPAQSLEVEFARQCRSLTTRPQAQRSDPWLLTLLRPLESRHFPGRIAGRS